jgi:hypothetical protein
MVRRGCGCVAEISGSASRSAANRHRQVPRFLDSADLGDDAGTFVEHGHQALVHGVDAAARVGQGILLRRGGRQPG